MEFNTSILKSLVVFAILLTLISAIYSRIAPLFALNNIFFPVNEIAFTKRNDQSDFMACLKKPIKLHEKRQHILNYLQTSSVLDQ